TSRRAVSHRDGRFSIDGLAVGHYILRASFVAYGSESLDVQVLGARRASLAFLLPRVGGVVPIQVKEHPRGPFKCGCRHPGIHRPEGVPVADPLAGAGPRLFPGEPDETPAEAHRLPRGIVSEEVSYPSEGALGLELLLDAHAEGRDLEGLLL